MLFSFNKKATPVSIAFFVLIANGELNFFVFGLRKKAQRDRHTALLNLQTLGHLQYHDVLRLGTFLTLSHGEFNFLAFI